MKYRMFWGGAWRTIGKLYRGREEVSDPMKASAAVLFIREDYEKGGWAAVECTPAEIMTIPEDSRPSRRGWETLPDEDARPAKPYVRVS